jgi:hypothetical protein
MFVAINFAYTLDPQGKLNGDYRNLAIGTKQFWLATTVARLPSQSIEFVVKVI